MRASVLRLLTTALLGATACAATASDDAAVAWHAAQRASAAQEALSERYTAIWATLDATQKARFSAQERAWLNDGRHRELQACVARSAKATEAVARACEADVVERRLGALTAPARSTSSI
jgi:uncharacterized NAD(P)/FAD-binding protein YdhS